MPVAGMNLNSVAFLAAHAASAQLVALKAEVGGELKALIQESGSALHDLLHADSREGLTLDGRHVGVAEALSAAPAAAGYKGNTAGASLA